MATKDLKAADTVQEEKAEVEDATKDGEEAHGAEERKEMKDGEPLKRGGKVKRARGGRMEEKKEDKKEEDKRLHRRRGGRVEGKKSEARPDRRARGGGLSDTNPTTAAGRMTEPAFTHKEAFQNGGGRGGDNKGKNGRD